MKKVFIALGILLVGGAGVIGIAAARFEERIKPNTYVGIVPVGDLNREEAAKKLRLWWETERRIELALNVALIGKEIGKATPGKLGVTIDDVGSIEALPLDSFWDSTQREVTGSEPEKRVFDVKFKSNGENTNWLTTLVKSSVGQPRPARVRFEKGAVIREPEVPSYEVDAENLVSAIESALKDKTPVDVPVKQGEKAISDDQLGMIKEVVAEFSTSFNSGQTSRTTNLDLASKKIDGYIMMPGDIFSFNDVVGRRTVQDGYREAPVLVSGRHETGIGGGICQVSGTLYNAVLLSNLKIVKRQNHSARVMYLPVGRDATVSYPSLDFQFQNNTGGPISVSRSFARGKLTFRILGTKVKGQSVSIETVGHRSWGNGVRYVTDNSLAAGRQRTIEGGASGHAIATYRVVKQDGKVVKRELIDRSHYPGAKTVIAIGRARPKAPVAQSTSAPAGSSGSATSTPKPPPAGGNEDSIPVPPPTR